MELRHFASIEEAVELLLGGEVIIYPTETFFALGALASNFSAVSRVIELKTRDEGKGLPLIAPSSEYVEENILCWLADEGAYASDKMKSLIDKHWPGALTLVFDCPPNIELAPEVSLDRTCAVRCSSSPTAAEIARQCNAMLIATSANISGHPPTKVAEEVSSTFEDIPVVSPQCGDMTEGLPSTIVRVEGENLRVLRQGAVVLD